VKTALDKWLETEPAEHGAPERKSNETSYQYALRWWLYWVSRDAEKKRIGWKPGAVPR